MRQLVPARRLSTRSRFGRPSGQHSDPIVRLIWPTVDDRSNSAGRAYKNVAPLAPVTRAVAVAALLLAGISGCGADATENANRVDCANTSSGGELARVSRVDSKMGLAVVRDGTAVAVTVCAELPSLPDKLPTLRGKRIVHAIGVQSQERVDSSIERKPASAKIVRLTIYYPAITGRDLYLNSTWINATIRFEHDTGTSTKCPNASPRSTDITVLRCGMLVVVSWTIPVSIRGNDTRSIVAEVNGRTVGHDNSERQPNVFVESVRKHGGKVHLIIDVLNTSRGAENVLERGVQFVLDNIYDTRDPDRKISAHLPIRSAVVVLS